MAFGTLQSFATTDNTVNILYSAPSSNFTEGRVYVVNMNSVPVKIRIAVLEGSDIDNLSLSNYIIYNRQIGVGERFVSEELYLKDEESVVVKSDLPDVKFAFRGSEVGVTTTVCGIISTFSPTTNIKLGAGQTVFNLPESLQEIKTNLYITNTSPDYVEISVGVGQSIGSNHYLFYNKRVGVGSYYCQEDLRVGPGEIIFAKATSTLIST
jgi:hypothetical protein